MKKIIGIIGLLFLSTSAFSQEKEGHVKFVVDISTDDPERSMEIAMMKGTTMEIFFKDELTRSVIDLAGIVQITNIVDNASGKALMLIGGLMGNKAAYTTTEELNNAEEDQVDFDIELTDEKKMISGYNCKKAILTDENGDIQTYWYTDEINIVIEGNQFINNKIPGFPMEISLDIEGMFMAFTVESFNKKVENADQIFDLNIPESYQEVSIEEIGTMGF